MAKRSQANFESRENQTYANNAAKIILDRPLHSSASH